MDESVIGEHFPGYEFTIERGKIREFARATRSANPDYLVDPQPVIPPTWLMASSFWAPDDLPSPVAALDIDLARLLHGGQEFVFTGPPSRAGDVLTTESWVDRVYEKEGKRGGTMHFAEVVTAYRDADDVVVAESRLTLIVTAKPPSEES